MAIIEQTGFEAYNSERTNKASSILNKELVDSESIANSENQNKEWDPSKTEQNVKNATTINRLGTEEQLSAVSDQYGFTDQLQSSISGVGGFFASMISNQTFKTIINEVTSFLASAVQYKDGITETSFGSDQEMSWSKWFSRTLNASSPIKYITDTPLGSGLGASAVYGNLIMGTPLLYTSTTDPDNRASINTFAKDIRFLSLTPGLPRYNGGYTEQLLYNGGETFKTQTKTPDEALNYLKKNGLDVDFGNKDKRYYTFQTKFDEYYSYLETMLNTVYIKMGLAETNGKFELMSFFSGGGPKSDLQGQYKSSLGFVTQGAPQVSESVSNTEYSNNLEADINAQSDQYQELNYLTGMGSAGSRAMRASKSVTRTIGIGTKTMGAIKGRILSPLLDLGNGGIGSKLINLASNFGNFVSSNDMSAIIQQFSTTNGMKVKYPNLWSDSSYSKNMNFDFEFASPYGDPLSIFHYVYVPFFALLTFSLPRQADANGYVSPFFVRADIPGHMVSDLALISDMTWTKGGSSGNLFTKDGLPRSIHCTITLTDLFQYLAMTKRISFLSANPSYTVFLDSMAGMHAIYDGIEDTDYLNQYYKDVLNRISGSNDYAGSTKIAGLYNNYSNKIFQEAKNGGYNSSSVRPISKTMNKSATPWFTKI